MNTLKTHYEERISCDYFHAAVLEGYWKGFCSYEIADWLGADPVIVARIMDDYATLGY